MRITDLNKEERLALIGWSKLIIRADKEFSDEEADELKKLAQEMGTALFKEAVAEAKETLKTIDDLKALAEKITSQEARELIFSVLYDIAVPGTIVDEEAKVLQWLAKTWGVYSPI